MHKNLILTAMFVFALGTGVFAVSNPVSHADGNGSPNECLGTNANVTGSIGGSADSVSHDVGAGNVADGVCIKSGQGTFGGATHSGVLGNGIHDNGCYKVEGVGTQEVTVTRLIDSNVCKEISHIDVLFSEEDNGNGNGNENGNGDNGEKPEETPAAPKTTEVGGGPETPGVSAEAPSQVQAAPVSGVSAGGGGGSSSLSTGNTLGLLASIAGLGYGVLRIRRFAGLSE